MNLHKYQEIKELLGSNKKLIAVSKGQSIEKIRQLYEIGHRDFGENFLQELSEKKNILPEDIRWHFLGNIQSNKLNKIVKLSHMIHSISRKKIYDSLVSKDLEKSIDILLQLKLGDEISKSGMSCAEIEEILSSHKSASRVVIKGIMVIGESNLTIEQTDQQFKNASEFFLLLKSKHPNLEYFSMGMSGDYLLALKNGSNMIRLGSLIFGERVKRND